jgi:hypothetical protein
VGGADRRIAGVRKDGRRPGEALPVSDGLVCRNLGSDGRKHAMDDTVFDCWTRTLGARLSRRRVGVSAGGFGALAAWGLAESVEAKKKSKKKKKKKKKASQRLPDGAKCVEDGDCLSNFCGFSPLCGGDRCVRIQNQPCTSECGCASSQLACGPSACGTENVCCLIEGAFSTQTCGCCAGLKSVGNTCVPA